MASLYKKIFISYPFPIYQPQYLEQTMKTHVDYFGAELEGKLVALSSAEKDKENKNVEMTDFATLPEWRGYGLAQNLLLKMEKYIRQEKFLTAYTIARAYSLGMNLVFANNDYIYRGCLINNTNISGQIESMNVWSKNLK